MIATQSPAMITTKLGGVKMAKYLVAYAKIIVDKDNGISLAGVYFGGIGDTKDEAEVIARDCVNTIRGGTILPKVMPLEDNGQVLEALYDATDKFERVTQNMVEADATVNRARARKKR